VAVAACSNPPLFLLSAALSLLSVSSTAASSSNGSGSGDSSGDSAVPRALFAPTNASTISFTGPVAPTWKQMTASEKTIRESIDALLLKAGYGHGIHRSASAPGSATRAPPSM
jgi:hypothetical protein